MRKFVILLAAMLTAVTAFAGNGGWIRVNQLGYLEKSEKIAVLLEKEGKVPEKFELRTAGTDEVVKSFEKIKNFPGYGGFETAARLNFSEFEKPGRYYIYANGVSSPEFEISNSVYDGSADFVLKYMRQQQCGYNPFLKDSCHTHDGFRIYHPADDSAYIDVKGGWHDASDYLQYTTTSANATFQMLFAYYKNPESFGDEFDANGDPGANGIPDILDNAKWGLDWLDRMNPKYGEMYNQIADDRDHASFRLPTLDSVNYGKGFERPVYFCNGEIQGVLDHKNRTEGIASTAGKYASAFTLGAKLMEKYYPEFSKKIKAKGKDAYKFAKEHPGACQTAPCRAPYFYEEDNWVDDTELAAAVLFYDTKDKDYLKEAAGFGRTEQVTPWMGADTARHYQWYPFVNLGHYFLASSGEEVSSEFIEYMRRGIDSVYQRGKNDPFNIGIPFIWCSNNLVAAMLTQINLYEELTGDRQYAEMEAALRDWLFGTNPWGTSMIVGLPENGDTPVNPHSAFTHNHGYKIDGGLVDGPVYDAIYKNLKYLHLFDPDEYAQFQSTGKVYHDDAGDYSTNEPTMDGTASLTYYLSSLEAEGKGLKKKD